MAIRTTRSKAYPALDLQKAIEVLRRQVEGLGWGSHDREAIAQALGYRNGQSGQAARKIAAQAHFGLLERKKGLYRPTQLARKLLEHNDNTARAARRAAFLKPTLFREVVEAHEAEGRLPRLLATTLVRAHGITEAVKDDVATILLESGQFAGVIGADGELIQHGISIDLPLAFPAPQSFVSAPEAAIAGEEIQRERSVGNGRNEGELDRQMIRVVLTGSKHAELILPTSLNLTDIELLKMQLAVFERQAQINSPTTNVLPYRGAGRP